MPYGHARAIAVAGLLVIACNTSPALAQDWPTRPFLVVSPFGPGTTYDYIANVVLDQVALKIGKPFAIENRPGDGGTVGVTSVVKANPDGYTLLLTTSSMSTAVILRKSLPYDALRDLAPVAMFGAEPSMLVAAPGKNYSHVTDLVAAAKAKPGELKFGSVGIGSAAYIAGERFCLAAGIDVEHVAYPGPGEALADLEAGRLDFYFLPIMPALPLIIKSKIVPLAATTHVPALSFLPTLADVGYPVDPYLVWAGLSAPAKTPHDIIVKLNKAIGEVLDGPGIRAKFDRIDVDLVRMTPEQFGQFFAEDIADMIKLGKGAHITPTD